MTTGALSSPVLRFDGFEVDPRSREVRRNGTCLRLQDQPLEVLLLLVERKGGVVTREELKHRLWPADTFVASDDGLNTAIRKLREALGDSAERPVYIETIPRRGYRFVGLLESTPQDPVTEPAGKPVPEPALDSVVVRPPRRVVPRPLTTLVITALVFLLVGAGLFYWRMGLHGHGTARHIESLAVLPLANLSNDPEQEYFADGMTETLITNLAQFKALRVISRTSTMHYKGTQETLPQIARELKVDAVIEGTVQRSGNRLQVTANLIPAETDAPIWAKTYERDSQDVLVVQSALAQSIAAEIEVHLTPQEEQHLSKTRAINPDAYNAYLLGNYLVNKRTRASIEKAIEHFQEAIRIDPQYALAYAGVANAYFEREVWGGMGIGKSTDQIRAVTLKALALDPDLAEGHALLARIHFQYDWDWRGTETEFKQAIELNPNLPNTYSLYSFFLQAMGRNQEAIAAAHHAVELDPLSAVSVSDEGRALYRARQFDKAIASYQRALELDPDFPPALSRIVEVYEQEQRYDEALAYVRKFQQMPGRQRSGLRQLARVYARMGKRREALAVLGELQKTGELPSDGSTMAAIYAALGDRDRAMDTLERGFQAHSILAFVLANPELDSLRSDPRFQQLRRRLGLP